jgi:hypothetical protein
MIDLIILTDVPPELDPEADNVALAEKFKPLLAWMKDQVTHVVRDGTLRTTQCGKYTG